MLPTDPRLNICLRALVEASSNTFLELWRGVLKSPEMEVGVV